MRYDAFPSDIEILQTKYGKNDLGFLFQTREHTDRELTEILLEIQSVGFGC